ncbi:hypothetical protein ANN_18123 [Periplaneta americana]|uniref:Uncharacterized protein n=1 Tax=Periplaneta americana TaxID=6978 RepID=A0ABQ8SMV9_PERAM|nr:hypothetical protein ANN_18123 [Periplaneta americana]
MAGLCEGGNEPSGSLKAICKSTGFLNMCSHNVVSTGCNKSPLCILCYFKMNDVIDNPADCEGLGTAYSSKILEILNIFSSITVSCTIMKIILLYVGNKLRRTVHK